jgi:ABC-type multidrug transport system ATPase subunit
MIKLTNLTKRFGSFTAVDSLSIEIKAGEFYGILGPNGAGKTTTIKMMTGLFTPTSGTITINNCDIRENPNGAKLSTGYIPDQPFLYEKLTGREFLYFSAGLYRMDHAVTTERIERRGSTAAPSTTHKACASVLSSLRGCSTSRTCLSSMSRWLGSIPGAFTSSSKC